MSIILGIDPGSRATGIGLIAIKKNEPTPLHHTTITTPQGAPLSERLGVIYEAITTIITTYQPTTVSIESIFFHKNAQSALKLGQARGAALCAVAAFQLPVHEYAPRAVKQAIVGKGAAAKTQIQYMVKLLLNLPTTPAPDAADALAIAITHAHHQRVKTTLKSSQITAGDGA